MEAEAYSTRSVGGQVRTFVDLLEADNWVPRDCLPAAIDDRVSRRKRAMGWRKGGEEGGRGRLRST